MKAAQPSAGRPAESVMHIEQYAGTVRKIEPPRPKPTAKSLRLKNGPGAYLLAACTLALCIYGSAESARRMIAERWIAFPADDSLERAVELTPDNGLAWLRLGQVSARRGDDPVRVIRLLRRAVELEPYSAEARIGLALEIERTGDFAAAERELLRAAGLDHSLAPALALANFYVRRGDSEQFWKWLRDAAGKSADGLSQAVELCWRAVDDPALILEKGVPDTPEANRFYLDFLLGRQQLEAAEAVWNRIREGLRPDDTSLAAQYAGKLLAAGEITRAVAVWNRMCTARLVPYRPLSPERGPVLTNAAFEYEPSAAGFDWRLPSAEGVSWRLDRESAGATALAIEFGGNQAENLVLLDQIVPVAPSTSYQLSFRYRTSGLPEETGIWAGFDDFRSGTLLARSEVLPASDGLEQKALTLRTAAGVGAVRLVLGYDRAKGTSRQKGTIWLEDFEMLPASVASERTR